MSRRIQGLLSRPLAMFLLLSAYALAASLLLCPLDALDMLTEYRSPLFFTVFLCLVLYPLMFIVTGAAAGMRPGKLWPVPIAVLAVLFAVSNCFGSHILSIGWTSDMEYYIRNSGAIMLAYVGLGYLAMLIAWLFFQGRQELYASRFWAVLAVTAMGPLTFGAAYIPGFCWGHPLWGEALWYLMHLGLAAAVGVFSGGDIRRRFMLPIFPFLVTHFQIGPPVLPGSQPKLPWWLGESWACICLAVGILCALCKALLKPRQ